MVSDSSVPPPHAQGGPSSFSREETEAFVTYARSRVGEAHGDRMLEWCSSPEFRSRNVRVKRTRTLSKRAIGEHIPEGVKNANFTETLDGSQRLIFYFRCLYDAIKELLRNASFAGRQYTHAKIKYNSTGGRAYNAFNTGLVYELAQMHAGKDVSPVPIFLSSDATLLTKKLGGHPIICESCSVCIDVYW